MKTHTTRRLAAPMLVALVMAGAGSVLHAQNGGGGNLTPEQRQQRMAEMREQGVRRTLTQANITDTATVDAVVAYSKAQLAATSALQEKVRTLNEALRNPNSTNEQITPLLADLRAAVTVEKARRAEALTAFATTVGYSKNARLEAALTLAGIIGDEASILNAGGGGGGRGGRGGGQGGGQGG